MEPIKLCCLYDNADEILWKGLEKHLVILQKNNPISIWNSNQTRLGASWIADTCKNIKDATLIVPLLSPDFLNNLSKDIRSEICAQPCPYFHAGFNQPNFITISASNNTIQVQINEHDLIYHIDNTYVSGFIGVQMGSGTEDGSIAFSNVRVWKL